MDESAKDRYDMILGRDLLIELWLNLKWSNYDIEGYGGPFKGSTSPMVDLVTYELTKINTGKLNLNNRLRRIAHKKYMIGTRAYSQ